MPSADALGLTDRRCFAAAAAAAAAAITDCLIADPELLSSSILLLQTDRRFRCCCFAVAVSLLMLLLQLTDPLLPLPLLPFRCRRGSTRTMLLLLLFRCCNQRLLTKLLSSTADAGADAPVVATDQFTTVIAVVAA